MKIAYSRMFKLLPLLSLFAYKKIENSTQDNSMIKASSLLMHKLFTQSNRSNSLLCFKADDKELRRVKNEIEDKIKKLEFKYQGSLRRQNIEYGIRGNRYYVEFKVNQANVDPDSILNDFLYIVNPKSNKQQGNLNDKSYFRVIDQVKIEEDDLYTLKLDFENASSSVSHTRSKGSFYIRGTYGKVYDNFTVTIEKQNDFNSFDIDAMVNVYENLFKPQQGKATGKPKANPSSKDDFFSAFFNNDSSNNDNKSKTTKDDPISVLNKHGVVVFQPGEFNKNLEWSYLAGYENVKRMIEDTILLGLTHGEIYDQITAGTRVKFETNRPKAVLFEGPPGCGKTTSAKIIANQVNIPLIYMPLESIMSKWYGESETKFADIFEAAKALGKSIIFIDEIDALATSREGGIHEATRRILSTLLRKLDGFESDGEVLVICATNRRKDLDPALLSRISSTITFDLPDQRSRALIYQKYAKQLSEKELEELADMSEALSGRDIASICKDSERRWASKYIRKEVKELLPNVDCYKDCLIDRKGYMLKERKESFSSSIGGLDTGI